ncbi:MAG: lamin tail domain-containing protein [Paludibacteraceae bacterium]|nr:lamin tail domain-containing protein [Paludibacteraceae bacterium]
MKKKMFFKSMLLAFMFMIGMNGWGQTTIAVQDFEDTPATPTWSYSATGGGTNTTASKFNGAKSYRLEASQILTMNNIDISGYTSVILSVAFAGAGPDSGEDLFMNISYDNGSTWTGAGSIKLVDGYSNTPININTTNASNPTTVGSNPWTTNIGASETQISVRFQCNDLDASEYYFIDDVKLTGTAASSCTTPTFSFASSTVNKLTTDAAFTNTFTTNNTSAQAFTSSNTSVATVNASTGEVTIVGAGTSTISVSQVADDTYCALSDSYTLNVTASEPSNHATAFTATANSTTQITVTWTDAIGGADSYLVKGSSVSAESITVPVDGTAEADAALVKNIASGVQSATFTGLTASTTYYFNIYPYNGTSTNINYKVDGSVPTTSAATATPLAAATATAATAVSTTGFTANWGAVSGATSYDVNVYTKNGGGNATDLFISEYIEGSSSNKYIEIYNGTGNDIDLSDYKLQLYSNGSETTTYDVTLSGTLVNGATVVYKNSNAALTLPNGVTATDNSAVNFNGDDAVALYKISTSSYVDIFGGIGEDPGTVWGTGDYVTAEKTLVRKSSVNGGITANPSSGFPTLSTEWDSYSQNTTTYLGSHTFAGSSTNTPITNSPFNVTSATTKELTGLSSGTAYYYTVIAKDATSSSDASNEITVITAIDGTLDASTLPDCPTCDLVVNNGGVVTLDAGKSYNSVSVKPGAKLTLNNGHSFSPGTFTLESDASGTATFVDKREEAEPSDIIATVQQHLPAASTRTWWYLASPVDGASSDIFGSNKVGDYSETTRSYSSPFAAPTALTAGKGYVVKMTAESAANYIFDNQTLNTGDISVALTRTVTETPDNAKRGFNLVGNPYPSYIDWDYVYLEAINVRPTIWYRTLNGASMEFHTYNAELGVGSPTTASEYIPPMQAFWVKVDTDPTEGSVSNGTLNFTNDMRTHDESEDGNPLKAPASDRQLVRLSISNGTLSDETVIATHPSASDSYDRFDSEKMTNGDAERPEIFSLAGNQELVINGISPLTDSKQVALGVRPGRAGNYTINLTEWRNAGNLEAVLRDNQLGEELILTESSHYSFDTDGITSNSRFSLLFRTKGSTTGFDRISSDLMIYASQQSIRVESASLEGKIVSVFNILGQPIFNGKAQSNRLEINGLTPAVYMVKINHQTKMVVVK